MTEIANPWPDDPLGVRPELQELLGAMRTSDDVSKAAMALLAFGRCEMLGVDPHVKFDEAFSAAQLAAACSGLEARVEAWSMATQSLGDRWHNHPDPWEADTLCHALLEPRTELYAGELACMNAGRELSPSCQQAIARWDEALREQWATLATVVDSTWLENYRLTITAYLGEPLPWWLGEELERQAKRSELEAERSPPMLALRAASFRAQLWHSQFPPLIELGAIAAAPETTPTAGPREVPFFWQSPDGQFVAQLNLPQLVNKTGDRQPRPLNFWHQAGGAPVASLNGAAVRLGEFTGTISADAEASQVMLSTADIRELCDGQLFVNDQSWELSAQPIAPDPM